MTAFELTFRYPSSFFEGRVNDTARSVGRDPSAQAVLGLDDDNAIILSKYVNDSPVTAADVAEALPQFDTQISELAGKEVTGAAVQVAGLPGIRYYDVDVPGMGNQRSRLVFLFSGRNQYLVNCQWTSARRDELNTSCDRVLATLQKTPGVQGS